MARYSPWDVDAALSLVERLKTLDGAMLPILHALQEEFGFVHRDAVPLIAEALNLSLAEVHGTISFYHDFLHEPEGERVVHLCRAEACQAVGCEDLVDHLHRQHGLAVDETSADGRLTIKTVYCLGNCALGPAALVDGEPVGRLSKESLSAICSGRARA